MGVMGYADGEVDRYKLWCPLVWVPSLLYARLQDAGLQTVAHLLSGNGDLAKSPAA